MLFDVLGALFSLWATYYFIKIKKSAWLITLLATTFNGYLYWSKGIYGDMFLESFYFLSACYGWYLWCTPKQFNIERPIIYHLKTKYWLLLLSSSVILYMLFIYLLKNFTDSTVVELDALTTTLSLIAQALMSYKVIFTWAFWLVTDLIYAYLYFHKSLPFHAGLMGIYLCMAVIGYKSWTKKRPQTLKVPLNCFE